MRLFPGLAWRHNGAMAITQTQASPADAELPRLESYNPATGELLGSVPTVALGDVRAVVDGVAAVQRAWAAVPLAGRAAVLRRAAVVLLGELDELAALLTREQGKPLAEAYTMELLPTIDALHWIADHGPAILGDERIPYTQPFLWTKSSFFAYEPLGVVAVISPWNYPWSIPLGEVAIALMCGNGVVVKPAPLTPLIAERIPAIFERAGLPTGLVRVVQGAGDVGGALIEHERVAKVFFTGSVEVGRRVGVACAERIKGSVLELGGKDPMLVLDDAPLEHAIQGALWGGFANAGQTCSGIERVYVARELSERFVAGVVAGARALRVGDPLDPRTEVGPMISHDQAAHVRELVDDAVAAGAALRCGGPVDPPFGLSGAWYAPAVLTGVRPEMRVMREEVFGPVLPIVAVSSEDEAITAANDSEFGLGASVWTRDRARGERIARRLEAGSVWINDHSYSHGACQCSWGGTKSSGLGRTHSRFGFYECVEIKHIAWDASRTKDFWWYPYDESLPRAVSAAARILYGHGAERRRALRRGARPLGRLARKALGR